MHNGYAEMRKEMQEGQKNSWDKIVLPVIPLVLLVFGYIAAFFVGKILLQEELTQVLYWWLTLLILGIGCYPLTSILFSGFHDGGYLFSKAISVAVSGWLLWVLSSLKILKFTRLNCMIVAGIVILLNIVLMIIIRAVPKIAAWKNYVCVKSKMKASTKLVLVLFYELLFLTIFLVACYMKCYKPEAYGTEKFMDYGFMTTLMRTDYMPPEDLWFSGTNLNYYYMGQYMATFLTKLSGVTVNAGYNLALMMLLVFCFMLTYSILYEVTALTIRVRNKKRKEKAIEQQIPYRPIGWLRSAIVPHIAGILGGIATTIAGNMHYTVYAKIIPTVQGMLGLDKSSYWFPDATRYIGYNPETTDKTIHEFPAYSFILGDLHAHVTNIMFVLTILGILFAWLIYRNDRMTSVKESNAAEDRGTEYHGASTLNWLQEILHPSIIMVGFFIGLFQMTNYWDFPIYFIVSGAVILFSNAVIYKFKKQSIIMTAFHAMVVLIMAFLVPLLFNIKFNSMAHGIGLCLDHTPLYQLAILWGLPLSLLIAYLFSLIHEQKVKKQEEKKKKRELCWLFDFINRLEVPDLFIATIGLCAAGLILIPELIYIRDIYTGDYKRANTMFKLTYQAFIMFGILMGFVIPRFILLAEKVKQFVCGIITGYLLLTTVGYWGKSADSWFGDIKDRTRFQGLDAAAFIEKESSSDAKAIDWLNQTIEGTPVVLEADGDSYTLYQRVSVLTGLPTVLGWHTHEWLWKDDYSLMNSRSEDVTEIYTSTDMEYVKELLAVYNVSYIYIGSLEKQKYVDTLNEEGLRSLGSAVYDIDGVVIIKVDEYIRSGKALQTGNK